MSNVLTSDQIPNFAGGLNSVSNPVSLAVNQMSEAVNARLTQFGAVIKRGGSRRLHASTIHANGIQSVTEWALSDGTRYIIAVANGVAYWAVFGSFPMTFTAITGSLASTGYVSFAQFRDASGDALYIADGGALNKLTVAAGPVFTLDTDLAGTASVRQIMVFNQRLWGSGSATFPQAVFFSALNNGDSLGVGASSGGQINVRTFGQQNVTELAALGTSLLIFHKSGLSRITGFGQDDTIASPAGISADVGSVSPEATVRVGNICYFVNVRGLFVATADGVSPVNTPEKPDPLSSILGTLTETQLGNVTAAYSKAFRELYIHIPTTGTFVYQTVLGSWSGPWDGAWLDTTSLAMAEVGNADNEPVILTGHSSGFVEEMDSTLIFTDNAPSDGSAGSAFSMRVTARRMFFGDFATMKSFRWGYILADLGGADLSYVGWQTGQSGGTVLLEQPDAEFLVTEAGDTLITESGILLAASTTIQSIRFPMWGRGYYMDITVEDTSVEASPIFSRIESTGFVLGRR